MFYLDLESIRRYIKMYKKQYSGSNYKIINKGCHEKVKINKVFNYFKNSN